MSNEKDLSVNGARLKISEALADCDVKTQLLALNYESAALSRDFINSLQKKLKVMKERNDRMRNNYDALIESDSIDVDQDYFVGVGWALSEIEKFLAGKE